MTWCLNDAKNGESDMAKMGRVTWCHCILNVPIFCGNQTPSWLPSSPNGEIVGNMMQSVVLDGNPPDEVIIDLMNLVNDVNLI